MNKVIVHILILLSLFGCRLVNFEQAVKKSFENYLDSATYSYQYIMLIPNSGCTGCISEKRFAYTNGKREFAT